MSDNWTRPPLAPTWPNARNCVPETTVPDVQLIVAQGLSRYPVRPVRTPLFRIGRSSRCDLILASPEIPEVHSYLFRGTEGVLLRHMGQGPQITVCGVPVGSLLVSDGDRLRIGPFELLVRLRSPHPATQTSGPTSRLQIRTARQLECAEHTRKLVNLARSEPTIRVFPGGKMWQQHLDATHQSVLRRSA